jgi:hypothetical protein
MKRPLITTHLSLHPKCPFLEWRSQHGNILREVEQGMLLGSRLVHGASHRYGAPIRSSTNKNEGRVLSKKCQLYLESFISKCKETIVSSSTRAVDCTSLRPNRRCLHTFVCTPKLRARRRKHLLLLQQHPRPWAIAIYLTQTSDRIALHA